MQTYTRRIGSRLVTAKRPVSPFAHLEAQLRELVAAGLKDREIGERLGLSEKQVWNQRQRLGLGAAWPQGRPRKVRA